MRAFLLRTLLFLAINGALFWAVYDPAVNFDQSYLAASHEKHERLRITPPPRLLLVGGSNVPFGFDCGELERATQRKVVNMGLAAGLGIDFMLSEIEPQLKRGDWALLSFEYDLFAGSTVEAYFPQLLEIRPRSFFDVPKKRWKKLLTENGLSIANGIVRKAILRSASKGITRTGIGEQYSRAGFDDAGCYVGHHASTNTLTEGHKTSVLLASARFSRMIPEIRERLKSFADLCKRQEVRCFFTFPPQPEHLLKDVETTGAETKRGLTDVGITVIDTPAEQAQPLTNFFDSRYHLTKFGAQERTRRVIERLK